MSAAVQQSKSYKCGTCAKEHVFPAYVYAHWNTALNHPCDCGAIHSIIRGNARQTKKGKQK